MTQILAQVLKSKIGETILVEGWLHKIRLLGGFKYGLPAHGAFGMGLERLIQKIIGLNNVKEATLFPRDINRLTP